MKFRPLSLFGILLLGILSCNKVLTTEKTESIPSIGVNKNIISPPAGTYHVQVPEEMADWSPEDILQQIPAELGIYEFEKSITENPQFRDRHRKAGFHKWYRIRCNEELTKSAKTNLEQVFEKVITPPSIQKNSYNDPYTSQLWHLYDPDYGINIQKVWNKGVCGSSDIVVAVLDGGIDPQHEDLKDILIPAGPNGSRNFVANNDTIVPNEHGTHVGGLIAAINNNGKGISSPAGGSDGTGGIKLLNCQIFQPNESGESVVGNYYDAFVWATDHGATICNNSWSFVFDTEEIAAVAKMDELTKAVIDYFVGSAGCDGYGEQRTDSPMKGGLVLFAAGNESMRYGLPASYEPVLAVGASNKQGERAYYSNYGTWVDICAPGGDGGSLLLSTLSCSKTYPNGRYGKMGGTSMACPLVSSVAALVLQKHGGQGFTQQMLREKLVKGSQLHNPLSDELQMGPLLDAYGALVYGDSIAPNKPEGFYTETELNKIKVGWKASEDPQWGVAESYILSWSKDKKYLENRKRPFVKENGITDIIFKFEGCEVGDQLDTSIILPEYNENYFITLCAQDYCGNLSASTDIRQVVTITLPPDIGEVNVYPNPVIDLLRISHGDEKEFTLILHNSSGKKIHQETQRGSAASPALLDMSKYAPGTYQLTICYDKQSIRKTIIK